MQKKGMWRSIVCVTMAFLLAATVCLAADQKTKSLKPSKENYDRIAKEIGYKGLYNAGIARFLYMVKHGQEDMNNGLKTFFWSDISENDKILDDKFEAMQLLDGFILYNLNRYKNGEVIQFTIMVPVVDGEPFLEGQTLRKKLHTYVGNTTYLTVMGVERTVPVFQQIDITEKEQ